MVDGSAVHALMNGALVRFHNKEEFQAAADGKTLAFARER
jgi:hypothetical protein